MTRWDDSRAPGGPDPGDGEGGWDHPAFLRTAWSELRERPFPDAVARIRGSAAGGTHATLVLAWSRILAEAIARSGAGADVQAFLRAHPALRDADRVLEHYTPERLASERARREFVLPDRAPLPTIPAAPARERGAGPAAGAAKVRKR